MAMAKAMIAKNTLINSLANSERKPRRRRIGGGVGVGIDMLNTSKGVKRITPYLYVENIKNVKNIKIQ